MFRLWASICKEASPYLAEQRSLSHFEFFGIDIILDQDGNVWLIECNKSPGLVGNIESYHFQIVAIIILTLTRTRKLRTLTEHVWQKIMCMT